MGEKEMSPYWLCIRIRELPEILGLFSSEESAKEACVMPEDCIGPLRLDERLQNEPAVWPGAYYPLAQEQQA